ncbi:hypothetical protein [Xylanimonas oleitrophica]|nr:hypothetical protein [Xylanimonas oleitrophica]
MTAMTDLVYALLTVTFFVTVALVARRADATTAVSRGTASRENGSER